MELILSKVSPLDKTNLPVSVIFKKKQKKKKEVCSYRQVTPFLRGQVLAENVYATQDVPPTHTTNVDGYAIRCRLLNSTEVFGL